MSDLLRQNLNLLMDETRLNAEELSRRIGIPASTIKKIRSNKDANPTLSTLTPIAQYFSLTISQLVGDEPFSTNRIKGEYKPTKEHMTQIPIISWTESIHWPNIQKIPTSIITTEHKYSKTAYALFVEEDDWENLAKGTALLIDPLIKPDHRDYILVHKNGQLKPTLKQAIFEEGVIYLKSVTSGIGITSLTHQHKILGVVVEYKKYLKN